MDNRDKGTNKKLWLIIVMIVVIVILLGIVAFLSGKDHGKATSSKVVKTVKVEFLYQYQKVYNLYFVQDLGCISVQLILGFKLVL